MSRSATEEAKQRGFGPNYRTAYLEGVKKHVVLAIWMTLETDWYEGISMTEIANAIRFDRSSLTRMKEDGELSLGGLIHILAQTGKAWGNLPPLPSREERIKAGRGGVTLRLGLSEDEFACLSTLVVHPRWEEFKGVWYDRASDARGREAELTHKNLLDVVKEIVREAEDTLGHPPNLGRGPAPDRFTRGAELIDLDERHRENFMKAWDWVFTENWEQA